MESNTELLGKQPKFINQHLETKPCNIDQHFKTLMINNKNNK